MRSVVLLLFISSVWAQNCTTIKSVMIDDLTGGRGLNNRKAVHGWSANLNVTMANGNFTLEPVFDNKPHYFFTHFYKDPYSRRANMDARNLSGLKLRIDFSVQQVSRTFSFVAGVSYASSQFGSKKGSVYYAVRVTTSGSHSVYLDLTRLQSERLQFLLSAFVGNIRGQGILSLHSIQLSTCSDAFRYSKTPLFPLVSGGEGKDNPLCRGSLYLNGYYPGYVSAKYTYTYCIVLQGKTSWATKDYEFLDTGRKTLWQSGKGTNSIAIEGRYFCQVEVEISGEATEVLPGYVIDGKCHITTGDSIVVEPNFKYLNFAD